MFIHFTDLLVDVFERSTPIPIAKNTISGIHLQGCILKYVKPTKSGANKRIPAIKTNMESASCNP